MEMSYRKNKEFHFLAFTTTLVTIDNIDIIIKEKVKQFAKENGVSQNQDLSIDIIEHSFNVLSNEMILVNVGFAFC